MSLQTDYSTGPFNITVVTAYRAVRSDTNADSDFICANLIGVNSRVGAIDAYTAPIGDNDLIFHEDYQLESNTQIAEGLLQFQRADENLNVSITFAMTNG